MPLRKPDKATVTNPEQLLTVMMSLYEAVLALQNPAPQTTGLVYLGTLSADPALPPVGTVYEYVLNGSLKARTRTAIYTVAA